MCQILVTHLACGHHLRGPLLQCPRASQQRPRGPPNDDGILVLCPRSDNLDIYQGACCEECFATMFRGFLGTVCQPCRRTTVDRMGQELVTMLERVSSRTPTEQAAANDATERIRKAEKVCKKAETACRKAEETCRKAEEACKNAKEACRKAKDSHEHANEEASDISIYHWPRN